MTIFSIYPIVTLSYSPIPSCVDIPVRRKKKKAKKRPNNRNRSRKTHCNPQVDINHIFGWWLKRRFYPPFTPTNFRFFLAPLFPCLSATPFFFIIDLRPGREEQRGRRDKEKREGGKQSLDLWGIWMCLWAACVMCTRQEKLYSVWIIFGISHW